MNVFVLGTGRCGTVTFAKACAHIANYTCAHESRSSLVGGARLGYPPNHIEVDPRLSWFLGELVQRFPDAFYVHLLRNPLHVAKSIERRWGGRASFARAFGESMLWRADRTASRLDIARFQIETMTANIELFLSTLDDDQHMVAQLEEADDWFPKFWDRIGAQGRRSHAQRKFSKHYNASRRAA